jgi:hypothetical protein
MEPLENLDAWPADPLTLGPIYPWIGLEWIMVLVAVVAWIAWHMWQGRFEDETYAREEKDLTQPGRLDRVMRGDPPG